MISINTISDLERTYSEILKLKPKLGMDWCFQQYEFNLSESVTNNDNHADMKNVSNLLMLFCLLCIFNYRAAKLLDNSQKQHEEKG